MSETDKTTAKPDPKVIEKERLNAALRANLHKRKEQARKRKKVDKKEADK